jgi:hypothetical protein
LGRKETIMPLYNLKTQQVAPSAARTATTTFGPFTNPGGNGILVDIDITAVTSTPSTTFAIQVKDPVSSVWTAVLTSAAQAAAAHLRLKVHPAITVVANLAASDLLSKQFRVVATHGNANSMTYSIAATLLP